MFITIFNFFQEVGKNTDIIGIIVSLVWLIPWLIFLFYPMFGSKFQITFILREVEKKLEKLKMYRDEVRNRTIEAIKRIGKPKEDISKRLDDLLEFFIIQPESMDPYGIVWKLEHLIEGGESKFENVVREMCPEAQEYQIKTLSNLVEVARGLNTIYRLVRHYYLLGKRTANYAIALQIQMILPQIMEIAEAYRKAAQAFEYGQPIGDGIGVLVAAEFAYRNGNGKNKMEIAKDTIVSEVDFEGRKVLVVRAIGPGATVGRPGEAVKRIVEKEKDKIKLILTVDAAIKLEGEESGKMMEGVGVAIGGPGIDKYKIEEIAKQYGIPLHALVITESITDAITPLREKIYKAVDIVVERIKKLIIEEVPPGFTAILAGIGNSVGIG